MLQWSDDRNVTLVSTWYQILWANQVNMVTMSLVKKEGDSSDLTELSD